jgi:hypothetical protein
MYCNPSLIERYLAQRSEFELNGIDVQEVSVETGALLWYSNQEERNRYGYSMARLKNQWRPSCKKASRWGEQMLASRTGPALDKVGCIGC